MEKKHECQWIMIDEDRMRVLAECKEEGLPLLIEPLSGEIIHFCWVHYVEYLMDLVVTIANANNN